MKTLKNLFITALALTVLYACKKDDHESHDKPEITITSPEEGKMYHDTIFIKAEITHKSDNIHEYAVELKKAGTEDILLKINKHVHSKPVLVDTFWVNTFDGHTNLKLTVSGSDHSQNVTTKTVNFSGHKD